MSVPTLAPGEVALVGAGPGDPGLLTRRAFDLLQRADVVLVDRLVPDEIRDLVPDSTICIDVGKVAGRPERSTPQSWIEAELVRLAHDGNRVVRLKGGDPFVFGRGFEELEKLRRAGVAVEVVPGLTSGLAGPALAGIPVTHRELSRSVSLQTLARRAPPAGGPPAADGDGAPSSSAGLDADTICSLMPLSRLPELRRRLLDAGRGSQPAALLERAGWPDQRVLHSTVERMVRDAERSAVGSPALVVVGPTAALGDPRRLAGPLAGRRFLVTRPREAARSVLARLVTLGAEATWRPLIRTSSVLPDLWPDPADYDWLAFTSPAGARGFFEGLRRRRDDVRSLAGVNIAAAGPKTAAVIRHHGLVCDLVPNPGRVVHLAAALTAEAGPGTRVLVPGSTLGRSTLLRRLRGGGLHADSVGVARTELLPLPDETVEGIRAGRWDAILLFGPSAVEALDRAVSPVGVPPSLVLAPVGSATDLAIRTRLPGAEVVDSSRAGIYGEAGMIAGLLDRFSASGEGAPSPPPVILESLSGRSALPVGGSP